MIEHLFMINIHITGTIGMLVVFLLNTLMPWRSAALVCLFVPVFTIIALTFVSDDSYRIKLCRTLNEILLFFRYPRRHYGYCPKIERSRQKNLFVGFGVGLPRKQSPKSSMNFNDTANAQNRVILA